MRKKKARKPKITKARTPNRTEHEETQRRKRESKRVHQEFDGIGNMMESTRTRSKADEDFSQAAARIVREATKNK
jgi:hypothetical protein